jgi:hypothetical protein
MASNFIDSSLQVSLDAERDDFFNCHGVASFRSFHTYDTVLHMQQMSTVNNESSSRRRAPENTRPIDAGFYSIVYGVPQSI